MAGSGDSVFKRQKVKKRHPRVHSRLKKIFFRPKILIAAAGVFTLTCALAYFLNQEPKAEIVKKKSTSAPKMAAASKSLKVKLVGSSSPMSAEAYEEKIEDIIDGNWAMPLHQMAKLLQTKLLVEKVALASANTGAITVRIKPYQPVLVAEIASNKWIYISSAGRWYGNLSQADAVKSTLPSLVGLKGNKKVSAKVALENGDETADGYFHLLHITTEAAQVLELVRKTPLAIKEIKFDNYVGFVVATATPQLEINLGRAPFDKKAAQLGKILDQLNAKGTRAAKIDLDHSGKAFVKEL